MLKNIKKRFTSLAPEKCILRRFVRFQLTPIRMVVINKTNKQTINPDENVDKSRLLSMVTNGK